MARDHLRGRSIQPGDDRTFETSERTFIEVATEVLPAGLQVEKAPKDLQYVFSGEDHKYGLLPEAKIMNLANGKFFFVEVKKQGKGGNAEERAMKLFTSRFEEFLGAVYGLSYHPYCVIFCESLATEPRYTKKFSYFLRPEQYLLWVDYDAGILGRYLSERAKQWLAFKE